MDQVDARYGFCPCAEKAFLLGEIHSI